MTVAPMEEAPVEESPLATDPTAPAADEDLAPNAQGDTTLDD